MSGECFWTVPGTFWRLFGVPGPEAPGDIFETFLGFRARRARETSVRVLGGGEGGVRGDREGGSAFFIENPRRGVSQRGGARGPGVSAGNFGGGGAKIILFGAEMSTKLVSFQHSGLLQFQIATLVILRFGHLSSAVEGGTLKESKLLRSARKTGCQHQPATFLP